MGFTIRVIQHVQITCFGNPLSDSGHEIDTWVGPQCARVSCSLAPFRFTSTKDIALKSGFPSHCQDLRFFCVLVYVKSILSQSSHLAVNYFLKIYTFAFSLNLPYINCCWSEINPYH